MVLFGFVRIDGTMFAKYLPFEQSGPSDLDLVDLMSSRPSFEQTPWFLSSTFTSKETLDAE
jgi:hypothetical protein